MTDAYGVERSVVLAEIQDSSEGHILLEITRVLDGNMGHIRAQILPLLTPDSFPLFPLLLVKSTNENELPAY